MNVEPRKLALLVKDQEQYCMCTNFSGIHILAELALNQVC